MPKASKHEGILRVELMTKLCLAGFSTSEIYQIVRDPEKMSPSPAWDLSDQGIDFWIKRAREIIKTRVESSIDEMIAQSEARLNFLWAEAIRTGNLQVALQVVKEVNELHGLKAPEIKIDLPAEFLPAFGEIVYQEIAPGEADEMIERVNRAIGGGNGKPRNRLGPGS